MSATMISPFCLSMIMAFEGFFATPYRCPAGVLTQGYGHTAAAGGRSIGGSWSKAEARVVLEGDLKRKYVPGVMKLLKRPCTQGQLDAFVSFAFNCGVEAFARSSILKFFNRGEPDQAAGAFAMWVRAAGKTMPGLVRRRASEALAFRGFQDLDFDGVLEKGEPIYGVMPQAAEPAREKLTASKVAQGSVVATGGGVAILAAQAKEAADVFTKANEQVASGATILSVIVAALIIVGGALAFYARWNDAGRPLPSFLRGGAS